MEKAKKLIRLSVREDAAVTKAAISDPNARPLTNGQWNKVKETLTRGRLQSLRKSAKN
jgi:heme-binding NEAT domain protein